MKLIYKGKEKNRMKRMSIIWGIIVVMIIGCLTFIGFTYNHKLKDNIYHNFEGYIIKGEMKYIDENKYPGYKEKLIALKKANPNWKFTIYCTDIDWNTAIYNETEGLHSRSLVQGKTGEWLCDSCKTKVYDAGGWMCASEKAVAYLMDSRNLVLSDMQTNN
mgnify:CR=1 FL=1